MTEFKVVIRSFLEAIPTWGFSKGTKILFISVVMIIAMLFTRIVTLRLQSILRRKGNSLHAARLETFISLIRPVAVALILVAGSFMILYELGIDIFTGHIGTGARIFGIAIVTFIALKLSHALSSWILSMFRKKDDIEFTKRTDTLVSMIRSVAIVLILAVGSLTILSELDIDIGPILAAAGIVGIAVGFGSQQLVQDVISGFFILIEDQIRVGDVVEIVGKSGLVEKITLRMIVMRDLAGNVHFIRNGQINIVTNMTKDFSYYVFDVGVSYREDVDEVIGVIRQVDENLRNDPGFAGDILEPIEILGLDRFADSAIIIKARTKTMPIQQWRVGREFNRRLKKAFDECHIEIPFPHVTLYMGEDKNGRAPGLNVSIRDTRTDRT